MEAGQRAWGVVARIDALNEWIGSKIGWLVLAMALIGAYNAIVRYLGRWLGLSLSSNAYIETQWYLFSLVFLFGAAYTLKHDGHVRVDVLYGRLSRRGKAWIDLVGTIVFLLPFCAFCLWVSLPTVRNSWAVLEGSSDPGGLPRYPIKTMIPVAFVLLLLQGYAELVKRYRELRHIGDIDPTAETTESPVAGGGV